MQDQAFEVLIDGYTGSGWGEIPDAPKSGPPLSEGQRDFVRKFGLSEDVYKRSYWSLLRDTEELRRRVRSFGGFVTEILKEIGPELRLREIYLKTTDDHCTLKIETSAGTVRVNVARDEFEDYLDSGANREALRRLVVSRVSGKVA